MERAREDPHSEETSVSDRPGETPDASEDRPGDGGTDLLQRALRSAGSDAAKYVPVRLVPALTSLLTVPVFTALIGTGDYGAFFLISSAATLAANLSTGWISDSLIRFYWPLRKQGRLDHYIATVLWGSIAAILATALVAGAATWMGIGALPDVVARLVPAGIVYFMLNTLTNVLVQIPRAANRAGAFARLQVWWRPRRSPSASCGGVAWGPPASCGASPADGPFSCPSCCGTPPVKGRCRPEG
jgi:hypothetical protein